MCRYTGPVVQLGVDTSHGSKRQTGNKHVYLALPFRVGIARRPSHAHPSHPSASFLVLAVAAQHPNYYSTSTSKAKHTTNTPPAAATAEQHYPAKPSLARSRKSCSRQSDNEICPFLFAATASSAAPVLHPSLCRDPASPTSKKEKKKPPRLKNKSRSVDSGQSSLVGGTGKSSGVGRPFLFWGRVRSTQVPSCRREIRQKKKVRRQATHERKKWVRKAIPAADSFCPQSAIPTHPLAMISYSDALIGRVVCF